MPCVSDYMDADDREIQLSRVASLLDELNSLSPGAVVRDHWDGYHPDVYGKRVPRAQADEMTDRLCARLQVLDVSKYSLELQVWWRDHQAADRARLQREQNRSRTDAERAEALKKLSPYERRLLGFS